MNDQVIEFTACDASIGYQARKVMLGPESDLVKNFLESGLEGKDYSFVSEQLAIFIEPKLASGFPDIVLAEFKPGFYDQWKDSRNELSGAELRMLSFLYSVRGANLKRIKEFMRISAMSAEQSLELLMDADLIDRDRVARCWRPRPLSETFGIKRLVAIEAKVCNSEEVLEQASLNRWFASESYALTPNKPNIAFVKRARRAGVGMVSATREKTFRRCVKPRQFALPSSYASWQFNEWIGRRLSIEGGAK